jgi:hypothetical protein
LLAENKRTRTTQQPPHHRRCELGL